MLRYIQQYRFYIALFIFLLIPIVQIDTTNRNPRDYRFYDRAILTITSPIQTLITVVLDTAVSAVQNTFFLWDVRDDNQQWVEENRKLQNAIAELKEAELENARLRKLLSFKDKQKLKTIAARVIGKDVSSDFRAIRIDRGEKDGVMKNMAVLTHEGIVGRVLRTANNHSDIVTIVDLYSAVDAIVERSRARGIVEGKTDDLCQLRFALRTDDIQPGDVLISSGLGGIFPKNVLVGTVTRVDRKAFGISQEVEVKPSVDFSRLEEVMIVMDSLASPGKDGVKDL
ncbi:MAG: rod shape-determining protein MreC [Bdellovibrionales bacterium]|nr:rod shape-determining protein MreC [Bdellovibrionales bacterium]